MKLASKTMITFGMTYRDVSIVVSFITIKKQG